ncbi:MAG: 1-acyl-sn-glycerol-3-phosphate acyltransferase [Flavobacteriales bacterium]
MAQTSSILYELLKPWVRQGALLFFRKVQVHGVENFPMHRPVILVANHQNAMLDPVLVCLMLPKQLHWLTRADVFRKPALNKLLRHLNMLPVYRERDKVSDLHGVNKDTFDQCNQRLAHHAVMCVFPEGTHRGKKQLIPLKKGVARMATTAVQHGIHDLCIVPVGLDYESYYNHRTTLLLNIGEPIEVLPIIEASTDPARAQNMMLATIRAALKELMLDIENDQVYDAAMAVQPLCNKLYASSELHKPFSKMHLLVDKLNHHEDLRTELNALAKPYRELAHDLHIVERNYREKGLAWWQYVLLVLAAPPALLAIVLFSPVHFFAKQFISSKVQDPLFVNSIRVCIWTFLAPVCTALMATAVALITCNVWWWLPAATAMVLCGITALYWMQWWQLLRHHKRCVNYKKKRPDEWAAWTTARSALKQWITKHTTT